VAAAPAPRAAEPPSYLTAAVVTFIGYFVFWVPGFILNLYFLDAARRSKLESGREPAGLAALRALMILFVYIPLAMAGAVTMLVIVGALIARAFA
jgi:hypothetical protein